MEIWRQRVAIYSFQKLTATFYDPFDYLFFLSGSNNKIVQRNWDLNIATDFWVTDLYNHFHAKAI